MTRVGPLSEAARRELVPTGRLRLAVNMANAEMARESRPGEFEGKAIELAHRLADDWGLRVEIVPFASGGAILGDMTGWDAAILAVDASRMDQVVFMPSFASVDATLATAGDLPIRRCEEADAGGIRIAVVRGAAYTLDLQHRFRRCELVSFDTPVAARAAMLDRACDFAAGIRSTLQTVANREPTVRLLEDDFLRVPQALAIPLGRPEAATAVAKWFEGDFRDPGPPVN